MEGDYFRREEGGSLEFAINTCDIIFISTFGGLLLLRGHYFLNFMVNIQEWGLRFAGSLPSPLGQLLQQQDDQYV